MTVEIIAEMADQLAQLVANEGIHELTVEAEDHVLRLRRKRDAVIHHHSLEPVSMEESLEQQAELEDDRQVQPVTSSVVGVFHLAASRAGDPLVKAGDQVEAGQLLGFVESMSLNHEVHSPRAGQLLEVLAEEGEPVEYGQALMLLVASEG